MHWQIYPTQGIREVVKQERQTREAGYATSHEVNHQGEGTVITELTLDVVSPSQVPADAEVLTEVHVMSALHV